MQRLDVFFLPSLVDANDLNGRAVVVIDILRATTTIVTALAQGASGVRPCGEIAEARPLAAASSTPSIFGGERGGLRIEGFQLGNSPAEYTREAVAGKTIVFTSTNGTRALLHARQGRRIWIGAFVNFSAVCQALFAETQGVLLCAGTDRNITREDVLFAGAVVDEAMRLGKPPEMNDQAMLALDAWRATRQAFVAPALSAAAREPLAAALGHTLGGRNLLEIDHGDDIRFAAEIDRYDVLPEYFPLEGVIRIPNRTVEG